MVLEIESAFAIGAYIRQLIFISVLRSQADYLVKDTHGEYIPSGLQSIKKPSINTEMLNAIVYRWVIQGSRIGRSRGYLEFCILGLIGF